MRTVGGTLRERPPAWEVQQRRRRALARLAQRRRDEQERLARARSMSRHPSSYGRVPLDALRAGDDARDRRRPVVEVVDLT